MSSSPLLIQAQNADVPYIMQVRECAEVAGRTGNDILAAALYRAEEFYLIPGQRWLFFLCSDRNGKKNLNYRLSLSNMGLDYVQVMLHSILNNTRSFSSLE